MNSRPRNLAEHAGTIHGSPDSQAIAVPANFAVKLNCRHRTTPFEVCVGASIYRGVPL